MRGAGGGDLVVVVTFTDLDSLSKGNVWPRASRAVRGGLYYYKMSEAK